MWILLTLLACALWAVCNYIDKHITERCLPDMPRYYAFNSTSSALLAIGITLLVGFWLPPWPSLLLLLVSGGGFVGMIYFYLKALKIEEASYVVPLFLLTPIWMALWAYLFLGETLVGQDLIAFIVILFGGFVLAVQKISKELLQLRPALLLMLVSTLFVSVLFVSFKYVANSYPDHFWSIYALQLWGQVIIGGTLAWIGWSSPLTQSLKMDIKNFLPIFFFNDFISFVAFWAYLSAFTLAPMALVGALGSAQAFFAFLIGIVLTLTHSHLVNENITRPVILQKIIGISIMFGGVALLQLS